MFTKHPAHSLHWFEPAAHDSRKPGVQKDSGPKHGLCSARSDQSTPSGTACGHLAGQETMEPDASLPSNTTAAPQEFPAHLLELGRKRLAPEPRALGPANFIHRLV